MSADHEATVTYLLARLAELLQQQPSTQAGRVALQQAIAEIERDVERLTTMVAA